MPSKSGFRGIHMSVLLFSDSSTKCLDVFFVYNAVSRFPVLLSSLNL